MRIKVCGMAKRDNIEALVKLSPDYIGFIFYPKSKRYAKGVVDKKVLARIPSFIKKVGVFVNYSAEQVDQIMKEYALDVVQLHGDESPEVCQAVKALGYTVIKAFGVDESFDFTSLASYITHCDFFLFDTKGKEYGGHGITYDWSILEKYDQSTPFFLSGGLNASNINEVKTFKNLNIHAVDVNSKFEIEPALKDVELLKNTVFKELRE